MMEKTKTKNEDEEGRRRRASITIKTTIALTKLATATNNKNRKQNGRNSISSYSNITATKATTTFATQGIIESHYCVCLVFAFLFLNFLC